MATLDRQLQLQILEKLAEMYPGGTYDLHKEFDGDAPDPSLTFLANLQYLQEHDLLVSGYEFTELVGRADWSSSMRTSITARGLDFLADDGGLSAILGTVVVRIDAAQFAELLAQRIEQLPNVSAEEKATIAGELRKLPAKSAEKVVDKLLDWTVDHAGEALPVLRALLQLL